MTQRRGQRRLPVVLAVLIAMSGAAGAQPAVDVERAVSSRVSKFGTNAHTVRPGRDGTLRIRLTWSEPEADLDLYLVEPSCTDLYSDAGCAVLVRSEGVQRGQESISHEVRAGEQLLVLVDNLHPGRAAKYRLELDWMSVP
jgi:hypothetical protein